MSNKTIRIIAAIVDTNSLLLYKENGERITLPQGDPRIKKILETAVPSITRFGYADITLDEGENPYAQFEEKSNGAVRFFRVAKEKLKRFFGMGTDVPAHPFPAKVEDGGTDSSPVQETRPEEPSLQEAVSEILEQHATPVTDPSFNECGLVTQGNIAEEGGETIKAHTKDVFNETIVAVVDNKIIPGMEKIKTQFVRASKLGSTIGVENFLRRLGNVIDQRKHSVDDLLSFMERGDLPIADDGSILVYKVLKNHLRRANGLKEYRDRHTGKVPQWVGAYVCMDPSLVDQNRRNECSNGLHIARRGYIREFSGDVCVLCKLAPEDVIAVPEYDANKMRVCGYHIIFELTEAQYRLLQHNRPITEDGEGQIILAHALAGNHVGRTDEVRITEQRGGGVQIIELQPKEDTPEPTPVPVTEVEPVHALENPDKESKDTPVDPKAVAEKVEQETKVAQTSRKDEAKALLQRVVSASSSTEEQQAWDALKAFKKACKVSWDKLGVPASLVQRMEATASATTSATQKEADKPRAAPGEGSHKERIQKLLSLGSPSTGVAQTILKLKREAKKGWTALGVSEAQAQEINRAVAGLAPEALATKPIDFKD